MVHYKLSYFPVRVRAETARQLFALAGVEYEDERIPRDKWLEYKSKTPFGQIPVLEVDGEQLGQSTAIERYLARLFGYAGKTPFEEALVDSLADQYKDYLEEIRPYFVVLTGFREGDKEKLFNEVAVPARDKFFSIVKSWLAKSGSGFLVGDSLTYVDLTVAENVATLSQLIPHFFDHFPEVTPKVFQCLFQVMEHSKRIHSLPAIKKWIETRPESSF